MFHEKCINVFKIISFVQFIEYIKKIKIKYRNDIHAYKQVFTQFLMNCT